jgi:hypothetical protein
MIAWAGAGCVAEVDDWMQLRVEPAFAALDLDLATLGGAPPPEIAFRVIGVDRDGDETDVTAWARFEQLDRRLGDFTEGRFTSALVAGETRVAVSLDTARRDIPLAVSIRSVRVEPGAGAAPVLFAAAGDEAGDPRVSPAHGAIVPPSLGLFAVRFAAADTDDVHEVRIAAPHLDVRVFAPGAPGPRGVELTAAEWNLVRASTRGEGFDLTVRSLATATPLAARRTDGRIGVTDRDVGGALLYGAVPLTPATTDIAGIWRYDLAAAGAEPWYIGADRSDARCVGCHVAVSADGTKVAISTLASDGVAGVVLDATTREQLSVTAPGVTAWTSATFAPGGRILSAMEGVVTIRDELTAAPLGTLPTTGLAIQPAVSPDGGTLAYVTVDDPLIGSEGFELVVHQWDAAAATAGKARVVVPRAAGGVKLPSFSPDSGWILYTRLGAEGGLAIVDAGGGEPIAVTADHGDELGRWVTGIEPVRVDGQDETLAWIAFQSRRAVGARDHAGEPQLWLVPFLPARGVPGVPIHLPGQPDGLGVRHAPLYVP